MADRGVTARVERFQTTSEIAADAEFFAQSAEAQDTPWGRGCAAVLRQCAAALKPAHSLPQQEQNNPS